MIHDGAENSVSNSPEADIPDHARAIFAWATPPGRSGVAVLRISGAYVPACAAALGLGALTPRHAHLRQIIDPDNVAPLDQALVLYFKAPHSFTGEDVLELHTHGSLAVRHQLTSVLSALPMCRAAEPGEFTRQAFTNGKLDLAQVEGLADVIDAQSARQLAQAQEQLHGSLSAFYEGLRHDIVRTLAFIEAYIDFPDEEIPDDVMHTVRTSVTEAQDRIQRVLQAPNTGEKIREGFTVAIIGSPNVGKSSLLNAIAKRDVAIVSDIPGTTRDTIEVSIELHGYLVTLIDTAGLRETTDQVEQLGIERSRHYEKNADVILRVTDHVPDPKQPKSALEKNEIMIINKCDQFPYEPSPEMCYISAKTGENIDQLLALIAAKLALTVSRQQDIVITRARHRQALIAAAEALKGFNQEKVYELMAEELRHAAFHIGKITGKVEVDQLLEVIFSEFCIGK